MAQDQSSVERFVRTRGATLLFKMLYGRAGYVTQMSVGVIFTVFGIGLFVCGVAIKEIAMEVGSLGPMTAGVTNLILGYIFYSKLRGRPTNEAKMTPEARAFLRQLYRQITGRSYEWYDPSMEQYTTALSRAPGVRSGGMILGRRKKSLNQMLPEHLLDLLERSCFQYNRICGILELSSEGTPTKKLAASSLRGADEAILQIMHLSAMISRYPESASASVQTIELRIHSLKELAERLEVLQTRNPAFTDRLNASSAMDSVLEELKLDEMVRAELNPRQEDNPLNDRA